MVDYVWNNPSSGLWEDPSNWTPFTGSEPGANDTATVTGVATTQINVTQDDSIFDLSMRDANATLNDFGGPAYLNVDGVLTLGKGHISLFDTGILNIYDEAVINGGSIFMQNGTVQVEDGGILFERAGQIRMGAGGEVLIDSGGYWDITSNDGISQTAASETDIEGVLEKTGGAGTSTITGHVNLDGEAEVGVGTLAFRYDTVGSGVATMFNHSALTFDKDVDITSVNFTNSGQTLNLAQPQNFNTAIDDFQVGDTVKLTGDWHFVSSIFNGGVTELTLEKNGVAAELAFNGFNALHIHSGATTTITVA